jgi:hypothetical protein
MRESPLPPEFYELQGLVHYVRERIRGKEWSSSCPKCGGSPHASGEFPDRFRMWTKGKIGKPFGWCRVCNYKWTQNNEWKPDPLKIEQWRQERIAEEQRIKDEAERAIKLLTDLGKWREYYSWLKCDKIAAAYWKSCGIDDEYWWGEWGLGFDPMHTFWFDTGEGWVEHRTPTATIAVRDISKRIVNIKHRLLNPFNGIRYRMEYRTHIEPLFIANLDIDNADYVIKCEGEKKAAVTWLTLDNPRVQCYGLPSTPSNEILQAIKGKIIIDIIDPDVSLQNRKRIKDAYSDIDYRVVSLPVKIDDLILKTRMTKKEIKEIFRQARKV